MKILLTGAAGLLGCRLTRALEARHEVVLADVHMVGAHSGSNWDLGAARRVCGWEPRYAFGEDGLPREV